MTESARVIDWETVDAVELFPGVIRQAVETTTSTIVRYTYHPGCVFPVHQHPEEQVTIVHTGVIEFDVGGESVVLRAGHVAVIPGGVPHGARVDGDETVITDNYIASASRTPLQFEGSDT
jgi:quercetin dioxygenase-like cupin family protein